MSDNKIVFRYFPFIISPVIIIITHIIFFANAGKTEFLYSFYNIHILLPNLTYCFSVILLSLTLLFMYYIFSKLYFVSNLKNNINILLFSIYLVPKYSTEFFNKMSAVILLVLALYILLKSDSAEKKKELFFNTSFIIGLTGLLFTPFIIYQLIIFIGIILYGSNRWREWVLSLIGFILPYFLFFSFTNIFNLDISLRFSEEFAFLKFDFQSIKLVMIILMSVYMILFTFLTFYYIMNFSKLKINIRHKILFNIYIFFVSLLGIIIFPHQEYFFFLVTLLPFTNLVAMLLGELNKRIIKNFLFIIIFVLPVIYYVF